MASQLRRGRRVGIDYGDIRVGVAVTDLEAILVSPLTTLINDKDLFQNLLNIITDNQPIYIALGSPVHLSGNVSSKSKAVKDFAEKLKSLTDTDIYLIDERLTTKSAQHQLRDVGIESKRSKSIIDQMAAVNILNQAISLEASPKGLGESI